MVCRRGYATHAKSISISVWVEAERSVDSWPVHCRMQSRDFAAAYLMRKYSVRRLRRRTEHFGLGFVSQKVPYFRHVQSPSGGRPVGSPGDTALVWIFMLAIDSPQVRPCLGRCQIFRSIANLVLSEWPLAWGHIIQLWLVQSSQIERIDVFALPRHRHSD